MRYLVNKFKFYVKKEFVSNTINDSELNKKLIEIKKDKNKKHCNSIFNKNLVKFKKNILYFNYFMEKEHIQIKLDLTKKRNSIFRIKSVDNNQNIVILSESEIIQRNDAISFIKQLTE